MEIEQHKEPFRAAALSGDFWESCRSLGIVLPNLIDLRLQIYLQSADQQTFCRVLSKRLARAIDNWNNKEKITVLSMGCGRFREAFPVHSAVGRVPYSELSSKVELWGVDLDPVLLADTELCFKAVTGVKLRCGDGSKLETIPDLPEKFDLIYFRHQNFSDRSSNWAGMFASALARLSPDGRLVITSFSKQEHKLAVSCLKELGAIIESNAGSRASRVMCKANRAEGRIEMRVDGQIAVFKKAK